MRAAIAAAMGGPFDRRVDVVVVEIPGLVVTDRLAAAAAENRLACPDPLLPLAPAAPMRRPVALAGTAVTCQPLAS